MNFLELQGIQHSNSFNNLKQLNIVTRINYITFMPSDFRSVLMGIKKCESSEIYNLFGQTSVGLSFDQPVETIESIGIGILNFLEAIKIFNPSIKN
jgi:GDPmannose 4,6-dehydratase